MTGKNADYIVLGGGCFWCLEAVYKRIDGVVSVTSGYSGGMVEHPSYEEVCTGTTGHAEVVRVGFDPERLSLADVLDIFFRAHDPTTPDRQGADVGPQYRSIILYRDEEQKLLAEESIRAEGERYSDSDSVVTQLEPLARFWPAEEYHQHYFDRHPFAGYCQVVIRPKLAKLSLG